MKSFVGMTNLENNIENNMQIIMNMNNSNGIKEDGYFSNKNLLVGYIQKEKNIFNIKYNGNTYYVFFTGKIYNVLKIKENLENLGYSFEGISENEIILKAYIHFGYDFVCNLVGGFALAIWNSDKRELFLARDHLGIKPLYYIFEENNLMFSTNINSLLAHPKITPTITTNGISELLGLGPAHTSGTTLYENVYELKPAEFIIFNRNCFTSKQYWKMENKEHTDDFDTTYTKLKSLLENSIKEQIPKNDSFGVMLSGGLDSSIITAYISNYCKKNHLSSINTYSVDYVDNDKNFIKNDFQPNSDNYYINIVQKQFNTNHYQILIDTPELANALEKAMIARGFPGMADVDSSLLLFCEQIKKETDIVFSGECSDEFFAGYPWFFRDDALNCSTFPWSIAILERQKLLNKDLSKKINLKNYIDYRYKESLANIIDLKNKDTVTMEKKKISHLTVNWFMQTLLDRGDRIGAYTELDIRIPFCNYKIAEYLWNIPWNIKAYNNREKGLLRYIVKDLLPEEIVERKKSPYPKTHNPNYLLKVKEILQDIINNPNSPVFNIINKEYAQEILNSDGKDFSRPWYGQLMTRPQLIAYIVQINMWLEHYKVKII